MSLSLTKPVLKPALRNFFSFYPTRQSIQMGNGGPRGRTATAMSVDRLSGTTSAAFVQNTPSAAGIEATSAAVTCVSSVDKGTGRGSPRAVAIA